MILCIVPEKMNFNFFSIGITNICATIFYLPLSRFKNLINTGIYKDYK